MFIVRFARNLLRNVVRGAAVLTFVAIAGFVLDRVLLGDVSRPERPQSP